ncbi:hypothetical protein EV356DRAFT_487799 [Viridothelium virens]|uniref:BAG domain-containing protein n=1 Tax=Viridothelium virens TaxID=1048519 RepID=A0A6A6H4W3_VIRVR|nr:hypothetical protein EV356DRAFT_487799 [Viridothelium virens]
MSWSSRWPSWSGRFSPFSRSTPTAEVKESDYEYVPSDHHHQHQQHHHNREPSPDRDTDVLVLKAKKNSYAVHFPAHSISSGELHIAEVRAQVAKKTGSSAKRIKLFYKGRNLKDDHRLCRDEGLHNASEILCVVGDTSASSLDDSDSDGSGSGSDDMDIDGGGSSDRPRRRRNRRGKKNPARAPSPAPPPPASSSGGGGTRTPQTPMEKLAALSDALGALLPAARAFMADPPRDPAKRDFEYKRLTETILAQILLKVDGVETEGDEGARARRKELVREAQGWLETLDRVHKGGR